MGLDRYGSRAHIRADTVHYVRPGEAERLSLRKTTKARLRGPSKLGYKDSNLN